MMPFLYQTRTITRLRWSTCNKNCQPRTSSSRHQHCFHTSLARASETVQYVPNFSLDTEIESTRPSKNVQRRTSFDTRGRFADNVGPTVNIRRTSGHDLKYGNDADAGDRSQTIDFVDGDPNLLGYGSEIDVLTNQSYREPESTITDSERHVFQRIFSDIFEEKEQRGFYPPTSPVDRESAKANLDNILGRALSATQPKSPEERQKQETVLNRYPPALRAAAARAIGLNPKEENQEHMPKPAFGFDEVEKLREPERNRVEGLLRAAETDFELWKVLEREVFPLIAKMGLEEVTHEEKKVKDRKPRSSDRKRQYMTVKLEEEKPAPVSDEIPPLSIYGPLYPSYLLLGLRLLDRSFSKPSPLCLQILPQIKSLGLISHVLGASTALYNELIKIYWYRHNDARSCLDLLSEMEQAGLEFDKDTHTIVSEIIKIRYLSASGTLGETLQALALMPEQKRAKEFTVWKEKIERVIRV